MSASGQSLVIATAPFVREGSTTNRMMYDVLLALVPVVGAAMYFFGITTLLVILASSAGACVAEFALSRGKGRTSKLPGAIGLITIVVLAVLLGLVKVVGAPRLGAAALLVIVVGSIGVCLTGLAVDRREKRTSTLMDGSALLTGVLLALTLPPAIPLWMAYLGGAISIGLGKAIFGGLGRNMFNPALVGRAFLQAAFPIALTTWTAPSGGFFSIPASTFTFPMMKSADVVSTASPLGLAKFEGQFTDTVNLWWGNCAGSLGETSAVVLLVAAAFLLFRRTFDWRLLVSTVLGVAIFGGVMHLASPDNYPGPLFMVFAGGALFAAVFMVTDPVTSPLTKKGSWIFGLGVGFLMVLIRLFGGLPEAAMYAVLLMNAAVPHIDRYTQPRRFGG